MGFFHSLCSLRLRLGTRRSEDPTVEEDDTGGGNSDQGKDGDKATNVQSFKLHELISATNNFEEQVGEGGFGKVYKGMLKTGQMVAIKCLNKNGRQGNQEFIMEILMLGFLRHFNLVSLIGYSTDNDKKLLVYEYMPMGSLHDHLFDLVPEKVPLDWNTRLRIALGTAKGLEYLHSADPPIIYRDLKSSNILLDENFQAKLSDFGLARLGPVGDNTHVSTRVMGTQGYCAPEYVMTGKLTLKSDIYSFGVVLLEMITGKKVHEHNLVKWARPFLYDWRKFVNYADPTLKIRFYYRDIKKFLAIIAECLQEDAHRRPPISDIVVALEFVVSRSHQHHQRHFSDLNSGGYANNVSSSSSSSLGF